MAKKLKRLGALLLALVMCLGMLNIMAFATEGNSSWWWDTTGTAQAACEAYERAQMELASMAEEDEGYQEKTAEVAQLLAAYNAAMVENYPITGVQDGKTVTFSIEGEGPFEGAYVSLDKNGNRSEYHEDLSDLKNPTTVVLRDGFTGIAANAFDVTWTRLYLTTVELPESVTYIGEEAFINAKKLASIDLSGVREIGAYAFKSAFNSSANVNIDLNNCAVGKQAFYMSKISKLTATDLTALGLQAFGMCTSLTEATVRMAEGAEIDPTGWFFMSDSKLAKVMISGNIVSERAFLNCAALNEVTLEDVTTVGPMAFMNCAALTSIDLTGVTYVGANAFMGCSGIETISISDSAVLEHSNIFSGDNGVLQGWEARMLAILAGQFQLDEAETIQKVAPDGWASAQEGQNNAAQAIHDTQIIKEAKWADTDSTVADVQFKAYYADEKQMDFVFLVDASASMASSGSGYDLNARLYDMQSKMIDVSEELLTTPGYDCRVAFTTFGATSSSTSGFLESMADVTAFVKNINTYYENTNYILGLQNAKTLVDSNESGRKTAVIFLSDGAPNTFGDGTLITSIDQILPDIQAAAGAIKAEGVEIYGVLQSGTPEAQVIMEAMCTNGMVFASADTAGFSIAVNNAIGAAYTTYTVTDVIGDDFDLVESSIQVSAGTASYDPATRTITWTITGMPFTVHTMTFQEQLKQINGSYPYGSFDTNEGDATVALGAGQVNAVATPVLTRSAPSTPGASTHTLTVHYVDTEGNTLLDTTITTYNTGVPYSVSIPDIEGYTYLYSEGDALSGYMSQDRVVTLVYEPGDVNIDDPNTPLDPGPGDEGDIDIDDGNVPLDPGPGGDEVDIGEDDVPLSDAPQTGDSAPLLILASLLVISGGAVLTLSMTGKKKEN